MTNETLAEHESGTSTEVDQRTHIQFYNPSHEDNSDDHSKVYWDAAVAAKDYTWPRNALIGELLVGCMKVKQDGDPEYLLDTVAHIIGHPVELAEQDEDDESEDE